MGRPGTSHVLVKLWAAARRVPARSQTVETVQEEKFGGGPGQAGYPPSFGGDGAGGRGAAEAASGPVPANAFRIHASKRIVAKVSCQYCSLTNDSNRTGGGFEVAAEGG